MARIITEAVDKTYTSTSYLKIGALGDLAEDSAGNIYELVLLVDLDGEAGDIVYPASTDGTSVSTDYTGGSSLAAKGKGFLAAAVDISEAPYCWIQRTGIVSARSDGSVAAGEAVIGHSVDGEVDTMDDGEEELVLGFALAADSGSPVRCAIQISGCI